MAVAEVLLIPQAGTRRGERFRAGLAAAGWSVRMATPEGPHTVAGAELVILDMGEAEAAVRALDALRRAAPLVPLVVACERKPEGRDLLALGRVRAYDVLAIPTPDRLSAHFGRLESALERGRQRRATSPVGASLLGRSSRMAQVRRYLRQAARGQAGVLLLGETGTGKELAASAIHEGSERREGPFVAVNCAAIPETLLESELFGHERGSFTGADRQRRGAFEIADGGTLFLDEIGEMPPAFQAKLLRVLQPLPGETPTVRVFRRVGGETPVRADVRVVSATNSDLDAAVRGRRFREDLLQRLQVLVIYLPPLRERPEDVPELLDSFLGRFCAEEGRKKLRVDPLALGVLTAWGWPANVRELEGTVRSIVTLKEAGDTIVLGDLPPKFFEETGRAEDASSPLSTLSQVEKAHVERVLAASGGNKARAARTLGISRPRLDRIIAAHRITVTGRVTGE